MNTKKNILIRVYISFFFFVFLAILIIYQVGRVQFRDGKYYRSLAESNSTKYITILPIRGNIYSSDGRLLVTSLPMYEIRVDFKTRLWNDSKYYQENIETLCKMLSSYFGDRTYQQYEKDIRLARNRGERYYLLKRNVNHNQLKEIRKFPFFDKGRYESGIIAEQQSKRIYPFKFLAERTLGYKVKNVKGVGLEGSFNEYLEGKSGQRLIQRVAGGNWIPINSENEIDPEDGKDLISTIDIDLQDITEEALLKKLIENDADNGCAVLMEVKTGHIKAIANLTKNPDHTYSEKYNYAIGASTEPGSTFKLASAIVLLEDGKVKLSDVIDTRNGVWKFYDREMKDATEGGYGQITFKQAFELSSNVAFSRLIFENYATNPKLFLAGLDRINITQPLNFRITGEGKPVFKRPGDRGWSGTTLPWMSVGYELLITPLQTLTLYNAIANNGVMVKPMFATEIRYCGRTVEKFKPEVINEKICSDKTIQLIKELLEGVVERGTAKNIKSDLFKIAGKTGTSLIALQGSYTRKKSYQASFAGYFPADNPKYSCIVVVNNPKQGVIYGGWLAAPVFREIADKIYNREIKPYFPEQNTLFTHYEQIPVVKKGYKNDFVILSSLLGLDTRLESGKTEWVSISPQKDGLLLEPIQPQKQYVPDVRGMVLSDAVFLLESLGITVYAEGYGKVQSQSILPGTQVNPFLSITLTLART